jgi:metal-responsive CopG/Arc/MetJ family transcriptional regulator
VVVKGKSRDAEELYHKLKSAKGVKHAGFTIHYNGKRPEVINKTN